VGISPAAGLPLLCAARLAARIDGWRGTSSSACAGTEAVRRQRTGSFRFEYLGLRCAGQNSARFTQTLQASQLEKSCSGQILGGATTYREGK
jgi:hypothetical protein